MTISRYAKQISRSNLKMFFDTWPVKTTFITTLNHTSITWSGAGTALHARALLWRLYLWLIQLIVKRQRQATCVFSLSPCVPAVSLKKQRLKKEKSQKPKCSLPPCWCGVACSSVCSQCCSQCMFTPNYIKIFHIEVPIKDCMNSTALQSYLVEVLLDPRLFTLGFRLWLVWLVWLLEGVC